VLATQTHQLIFWHSMPFKAAVQMEMDLAEDLRSAGYTVTGGH
jgi:hypothetical protein